jgi:hypothetical protein
MELVGIDAGHADDVLPHDGGGRVDEDGVARDRVIGTGPKAAFDRSGDHGEQQDPGQAGPAERTATILGEQVIRAGSQRGKDYEDGQGISGFAAIPPCLRVLGPDD